MPPRERLRELQSVADAAPPRPTAVGEADPHGEAWLIDDERAVRQALNLPPGEHVAAPTRCFPKSELERLFRIAGIATGTAAWEEAFRRVASAVQTERCPHRKETGFDEFVQDVRQKLRGGEV